MSVTIPLTFAAYDKLGLKPFGEKLERYLTVEHDFVEGSLVVALNAGFGAGKTTFLSMWKADLDERREKDPAVPKATIVNAWESDYCGDPLLSIVNVLIKAAGGDGSADNTESANRLREAAKDVGWFVTGLANNLVAHWTGVDPVSAGELAESKKQDRQSKAPDFVALYEERTKALERLKVTLRDVFGGASPKAFLFVDELDRCRPDYAISYLETIKHVFDVHGLVFVLAVDCDQLECSAKALFGTELRFQDYFRKFAQRTVALPEPDENSLLMLAQHYAKHYLEREGKRISLLGVHDRVAKNIVELVGALRMPPRQIQEFFRIIGHTVATSDPQLRGRLHWCIGVGVIVMAALKVADPRMYRRIGKTEVSSEEVGRFLINLLGPKTSDWWFRVYVTGNRSGEGDESAAFENMFRNLGLIKAGSVFNTREELGQFASGWGHASIDRWKQIYQHIEAATSIE